MHGVSTIPRAMRQWYLAPFSLHRKHHCCIFFCFCPQSLISLFSTISLAFLISSTTYHCITTALVCPRFSVLELLHPASPSFMRLGYVHLSAQPESYLIRHCATIDHWIYSSLDAAMRGLRVQYRFCRRRENPTISQSKPRSDQQKNVSCCRLQYGPCIQYT